MIIWIDAQLSPALASWITENFNTQARAIHDLGLLEAEDQEFFHIILKLLEAGESIIEVSDRHS